MRVRPFAFMAAAALLSLAQAGCASRQAAASGDETDLPPAFSRILRSYERAWGEKDAAALAALFAEDGFVLPNGAPPVRGRNAIRDHYQGAGGPLFLRALAWSQSEPIGFIIGEYAHEPPPAPATGKFTLTLRGVRQHPDSAGYRWFIMSDMDSSNRRPQARPQ